jgi:uncharacterized protein YbbC (DUF1343 family)
MRAARLELFRLDALPDPATVISPMAAKSRLRVFSAFTLILALLFGFVGCSSPGSRRSPPATAIIIPPLTQAPARSEAILPVMLGIDVLERDGFAAVRGKRIGLLTHAAGVNRRGESTISVLRHAPGVKLLALFAPEHGLYGTEEAGKNLPDTVDRRSGLPVYSLHGRNRRPTPEMLKGLDALVVDLQDIGARSYTFSSAMLYAMEACFQNNVEVVVLDRPNPLGGLTVGGPPMDADLMSYVGAFRTPYVHGLTIGELARMAAAAPGGLAVPESVRLRGRLTIVPMRGWRRSMRWPDTGLSFVPTSPFVQDFAGCVGYAMTGLGCEIGGFSHGVSRSRPFIAYKGRTSEQLQRELEALRLPGLAFTRTTAPEANNRPAAGVYVDVTDWGAWHPTDLSFHMMRLACKWNTHNPFASAPADRIAMFNKLVGSQAWWNAISRDGARVDVKGFLADWHKRAEVYQSEVRRYWLYPE